MTEDQADRMMLVNAVIAGKAARDHMLAEAKAGRLVLNIAQYRELERNIVICETELAKMPRKL